VSVPSKKMGVAVKVGGRGVAECVGVSVGNTDGEAVAEGVGTGSEVPQAAASKASMVNRKVSFFIRWIFLLLT